VQLEIARTVYTNLCAGFRGQTFECPAPLNASASQDAVVDGVDMLLQTFRVNGFAINASIQNVSKAADGSMSWTVHTEGGANLWGMQALQARNNSITDAFDAFAVMGFLDASGFESQFQVKANDTFSEQKWLVRPTRLQATL
jgi:hypothetical protein